MSMRARASRIASDALAAAIALVLLAAVAALTLQVMRKSKPAIPSVMVGTTDRVYYSHAATLEDATALGHALQTIGFFSDRGGAVLLSKNAGGSIVSFVLQQGRWNSPAAVLSFQEIGRRIAATVSGFPIEIRLVDPAWNVQKTIQVGKLRVGTRDEVYYFGSATESDAQALAQALRAAGYLQDRGVSVSISKGDGNAIGFVVADGVWQQPDTASRFALLARRVAPSLGGLPIRLRLISPEMDIKSETDIR